MYLDRIVATKKKEVALYKSTFVYAEAEKTIAQLPHCRGFMNAVTSRKHRDVALIAEVKKASPSKGLIREDFEPVALALAYERAGADCISVLTDESYFQGSNAYLTNIRNATKLPLLRKDFTIDEVQIYEARLIGADAILLIAAILTTEQIKQFLNKAAELGLDVLLEVHDLDELERVLPLHPKLIGINNRNLSTFVTNLATTEQLIPHIPSDVMIISESGISNRTQVDYLRNAGAHGFLIGEHFMRQAHIEQAVTDLLGKPFKH